MRQHVRVAAAALFTTVAAVTTPAVAAADLPTDVPTVALTVVNTTNAPMVLTGQNNPYGRWVDAPPTVIPAGTTEVLSAGSTDRRGFGLDVTYTMPGNSTVVLMVHNHGTGAANTDGTRIDGPNRHGYSVTSDVDTGYPYTTATYTITPR